MKKIIFLTLLHFCIISFAQNRRVVNEIGRLKKQNVVFENVDLLKMNGSEIHHKYDSIVSKATYASLDLTKLNKIYTSNFQTIEIEIPYQNQLLKIELYQVNLFTENFKISTNRLSNVPYTKGVYYRGIIKGNQNSIASFNFFEGEMNGIVSSLELGNLNIGKLMHQTNKEEYIIYSDMDLLIKNEFSCSTKDEIAKEHNTPTLNRNLLSEKCVTAYFEVGYQAYTANGNSLSNTTNWITAVFNNSQTLFDNEGISIALKTIFIWTDNDCYSTSSNFILPAFTNVRPSFDGDIGFIADIDPQQLVSQSYGIGGLCSDRKFAYGDLALGFNNVPNYSYPVYIIVHELGHSLGSHHTHACVWNGNNTAIDGCTQTYGGCSTPTPPADGIGTIMSYCFPNFTLGFGEQPANAIIQHINSSTCLGTDCINSCINTVGFIDISDVTQTNANVNWNDSDTTNSQWDISIVPAGDPPVWNTVYNNSYTVNNLLPNSYYEVTIKGGCSNSLTYPKHSLLFATQGDNCEGTIIYDTGGLTSGYQGSEHIIRTIVPTEPNKKIKIVFNNLNLVPYEGWLFIYDGMGNTGPLLNYLTNGYPYLATGFSNYFEPSGNTFESQDPSGALTLEFFSSPEYSFNPVDSHKGWRATISCLNLLGHDELEGFLDYSYSPNPTKDFLMIKSKDNVDVANVYNMEGKLLFTITPFSTDFKIDLSMLPNTTYTISILINDKKASFKVIKK